MRLLVFAPPQTARSEHRVIGDLFARGLHTLHVRKPDATEAELLAYLNHIPQQHRSRVVLHASTNNSKCIALAKAYQLGGIHYPERLRPSACKRQDGLTTSTAIHSLQDLFTDFGELDYVFLSPIFDSISKPGYAGAFEWDALRSAVAGSRYPVIALGGLTAGGVPQIRDLGFAGAAVIGAVWEDPDPLAAFSRLQEACQ